MRLDWIGRPVHPDDGAALSADSWPASFGEEIDLSAPYAAWFDPFGNGPLFRTPAVPATGTAPACVIEGFTSGLAVTNSEIAGAIGAADMMVPQAVQTYKVDGTGIRIGILSDSFNLHSGEAADIAAGLLPADGVTILKEGPSGNDEGRAMAELIHEVAPGAQIDFYSAFWSETDFANGIRALAQAGCNIIVDDVTYVDEPFFQDGGALQAAVEAVTAGGVSYFTSASNEGNNFYQANFTPVSVTLPGGAGGGSPVTAQRFSNGTALQSVRITGGDTVIFSLQWDQPFATIGAGHSAAGSLAFYLFNSGGTLVASAVQDAVGGNPVQVLPFTNNGATANYSLAIVLNDGAAPSLLKYIVYSGQAGAITINDSNAGIGSGSVIGHEMIPAANTVGAVNANDGTNPPVLEPYSSVGPGEVLFDANGNRLAQPIDPDKINFTAPDGIATSVFNPFYGTSAAAPNAAAVAALMLEANPNLTPAQVTADLEQSALVMNGGSNAADGAGFIQAPGALRAALGVACYCRGTCVATPLGATAIEALRIGDLVLTAAKAVRPIRWIGRRSYSAAQVERYRHLRPVCVRVGALGSGAHGPIPARDLRISPEHALALQDDDGSVALVPAHLLVNGVTIFREPAAAVEYLHLELKDHDIILAEGAPAETFVGCDSRALFDNAAEFRTLYPHEVAQPPHFCAPRIEGGPALVRLRGRLERLAGIAYGPLGGLHGGPGGGHLDRADREMVAGWVHDHANPDCPMLLEIVVDGEAVGTVLADRFRADMARLGWADGHCAFAWQFPRPLDPARRHIVSVLRAADGAELRGSPMLVDRGVTIETALTEMRFAPLALRREVAGFLTGQVAALRERTQARSNSVASP